MISKIVHSNFISVDYKKSLETETNKLNLNTDKIFNETDMSGLMEGLYIKVEEDGIVKERYKFVRHGFLQVVSDSETHWIDRPIIPNQLIGSIEDLFV